MPFIVNHDPVGMLAQTAASTGRLGGKLKREEIDRSNEVIDREQARADERLEMDRRTQQQREHQSKLDEVYRKTQIGLQESRLDLESQRFAADEELNVYRLKSLKMSIDERASEAAARANAASVQRRMYGTTNQQMLANAIEEVQTREPLPGEFGPIAASSEGGISEELLSVARNIAPYIPPDEYGAWLGLVKAGATSDAMKMAEQYVLESASKSYAVREANTEYEIETLKQRAEQWFDVMVKLQSGEFPVDAEDPRYIEAVNAHEAANAGIQKASRRQQYESELYAFRKPQGIQTPEDRDGKLGMPPGTTRQAVQGIAAQMYADITGTNPLMVLQDPNGIKYIEKVFQDLGYVFEGVEERREKAKERQRSQQMGPASQAPQPEGGTPKRDIGTSWSNDPRLKGTPVNP